MKKRVIIRIALTTLKALVALAAVINLVALFVFHYETPSWLRRKQAAPETTTVEEPVASVPVQNDGSNTGDFSFSIPVVPVNYSGEADMDALVLNNVYVQGTDGQPVETARIEYEILPGGDHQKKLVLYTATLESGEVLTETRTMNLTARYTGPRIALLGPLPDFDPADAETFAGRLSANGIIRADDGFGNDAGELVQAVFDDLSEENPDVVMTLVLENQVHDTYELELGVKVKNFSGVVLKLTDYNITLNVGDEFDPYAYIDYAHDEEGNDLSDDVIFNDYVETDEPGEYHAVYWVWNSDRSAHSPDRYLYVTVEPVPEETAETDEAP